MDLGDKWREHLKQPDSFADHWQRRPEAPCSSRHEQESFSSFLGEVHKDLQKQPQIGGSFLEISMQRDWALLARSPLGRLTAGGLAVRARRLLGRGLECAPSIEDVFSYNFLETPLSSQLKAGKRKIREQERERAMTKRDIECRFDGSKDTLRLVVPLPLSCRLDAGGFMHVLSAWANAAAKSLAGAATGTLLTAALSSAPGMPYGAAASGLLPVAMLPLKLGSFDPSFISSFLAGVAGNDMAGPLGAHGLEHVGLFSLTAAVMFIGSIRGLNKHSTAKQGNWLGIMATALGIISVLAAPSFAGAHARFFLTFALASIVGLSAAQLVQMEEMPELVAGFHSFVGLAAVFVGLANFFAVGEPFSKLKALETFLGTAIGSMTFTGSIVAAGKLHGWIPGRPIIIPFRWPLNIAALTSSAVLAILFTQPNIYASSWGVIALLANIKIWGALGSNMVLPIGGADMPVVVSLLNAFSGLATSAAGFMLSNNLLTITGALVTSSGWLLSDIMCKGINRSMLAVLLGGFGTDGTEPLPAIAGAAPQGPIQEVSSVGMLGHLLQAKRICIVPGYGLAVARCQGRLAESVALLRSKGVTVHFAIHPVAGRLPGHMNVLLAEANVPYDIVKEMDEVNAQITTYDLALVIGANDIVNPATQSDPTSPIYGMPAIEIWKAQTVVVMKRSMATGYSGVDNPLFYCDNVRMLFGDAKATIDTLHTMLVDSKDQIQGDGNSGDRSEATSAIATPEVFPEATHSVGIIRERKTGERRVSISPVLVPKLRKMGFSIWLEAGAGQAAGFNDSDYIAKGGVQVAESAREVLQQADVVLKVNEPLHDEVQLLKGTQVLVGFWNMFGNDELLGHLKQVPATFVNLSLVPRVSRAQKLDALTSMANIAGYRAVLDAFHRLPRFSRSSVTASGTVPPAKVFIIGAGIAGLSAIATAHAMGAKVFANDVRDAAREQVQGLGAEFIPIDSVAAIAGEGVGGYATEMSQDFKERQLATYARVIKDCDIVIATAMIPNRPAPVVITKEMIATMRKSSVIVDLAAPTGGNCELTKVDEVVISSNGVVILAETNYPSQMAGVASDMIGGNFCALLEVLGGGTDDFNSAARWQDPIITPATVVREGQLLWDPAARPPPPPAVAAAPAAIASINREPQEVDAIIQWIEANREELACALGLTTIIGLGMVCDVPQEEVTHIGYFVLALLIGHFTVSGVQPALHTPLVSVTNAISGIIVVGGMLQVTGPLASARVGCALSAVFLSSINIVGGFAVTHRMLGMFKGEEKKSASASLH